MQQEVDLRRHLRIAPVLAAGQQRISSDRGTAAPLPPVRVGTEIFTLFGNGLRFRDVFPVSLGIAMRQKEFLRFVDRGVDLLGSRGSSWVRYQRKSYSADKRQRTTKWMPAHALGLPVMNPAAQAMRRASGPAAAPRTF